MHGIEIVHAVASLVGVEVGGIEQMVAQVSDKDMVGEITVEWFHEEVVASDFA